MSISDTLGTAVSGLHANAQWFRVAAFNVVNANSDGFTAHLATAESQAPSGVRMNVSLSDAPVDLAREWVNMSAAHVGYDANAEVIATVDRMSGALLDIVA